MAPEVLLLLHLTEASLEAHSDLLSTPLGPLQPSLKLPPLTQGQPSGSQLRAKLGLESCLTTLLRALKQAGAPHVGSRDPTRLLLAEPMNSASLHAGTS